MMEKKAFSVIFSPSQIPPPFHSHISPSIPTLLHSSSPKRKPRRFWDARSTKNQVEFTLRRHHAKLLGPVLLISKGRGAECLGGGRRRGTRFAPGVVVVEEAVAAAVVVLPEGIGQPLKSQSGIN